ncbi:hypothetical protein [Pyrococcus horikoshii]|uniref:hypothetical protein n=1 Tax=Pyrococcus horikoshii TaxID=53953 RepID=UPI00373AF338
MILLAESVHVILQRIEKIEKELEEIKLELIKLKVEREEPEVINDEIYKELVKKSEHLKKHPEEGLTAEEAIKKLRE